MTKKAVHKPVSVRRKLSFMMLFLVVFSIGMTAIINLFFQDKYYLLKTREGLEESFRQLQAIANRPPKNLIGLRAEYDYQVGRIAEELKGSVFVLYEDEDGRIFTSTSGSVREQYLQFVLRNYLLGRDIPNRIIKKSYPNAVLQITEENVTVDKHRQVYELWGKLDTHTAFLIRVNLDDIENTVEISTQFLLILGTLFGLISAGIAIFFADRFTRPIRRLNVITRQVAEQNFDLKYDEDSYLEINELGESVNHMSETMENFICELKSKNMELSRSLHEREKLDEMRKDFISAVSHELKTPIALIIGYTEGLQSGLNDQSPEDRDFYFEVILDEAKRMNSMVKDLLMLSELESGRQAFNGQRFDVVELLQNIIESYRILQEQKGVQIRILHDGSPIMIWSDPIKLETVFRNFITNALNHVDEKKRIEISFLMKPEEGRVRVDVFNTGKAIPDEVRERIWDKFYKADKARTRAYGGNGIGLSIVKAMMDLRHLPYGCENVEDGVTFFVELETK